MLMLIGAIGFSGCSKDDEGDATKGDPETQEISLDDAIQTVFEQWNDWIDNGLSGKVKTVTETQYSSVAWVNNAIVKKGFIDDQRVREYNSSGMLTKYTEFISVPKACKWAKDQYDNDVIVVTQRELKSTWTETYTYNAQNRLTEYIGEYGDYTVTFGG